MVYMSLDQKLNIFGQPTLLLDDMSTIWSIHLTDLFVYFLTLMIYS
jgi:hypothetical protein